MPGRPLPHGAALGLASTLGPPYPRAEGAIPSGRQGFPAPERQDNPLAIVAGGLSMGLQRRALQNLRRHLARHFGRMAVLLVTDLASFGAVRAVVRLAADADVSGRLLSGAARTLVPAHYLAGWQFAAALILGLAVTGNYGSGDKRRDPSRLLAGCALASALPLWAPAWGDGLGLVAAQFVTTTVLVWLALVLARLALEAVDAHVIGRQPASSRTILVGPAEECRELAGRSAFAKRSEHALLGFVDTASPPAADSLGQTSDLPHLLHELRVETVVICGPTGDGAFRGAVEHGLTAGCHVFVVPLAFEMEGVQPGLVWKRGQPLVELSAQTLRAQQFLVKRLIDLVGSVAGLIVLSPVFALLAILVKLDSRGPVFFSQRRAGIGGRPFRMHKIRTMQDGADGLKEALAHLNLSGDPRLFKIAEDPRVTRVGQWLRRWSLDELPQLWNVLVGEMSLVGPRPFFESDLDYYEIHHFGRLGAKPGITGLWQVNGRSAILDFEEVVALDTKYVREWSLLLDLEILLQTPLALLRRRGAM